MASIESINNVLKFYTIDEIEKFYLDYFNNFLTVEKFAEYYGFSFKKAVLILDLGRKLEEIKEVTTKGI